MGYDNPAMQTGATLAERYAAEFPVSQRYIYLNHAAVSPLPRRTALAMQQLATDVCENGSHHFADWLKVYAGARDAAARLVNATSEEIAFVKNTSEGISTVALGLKWKAGDKIVAFREEFPANLYIWKKLEEWHGVQIEWLSCFDSLDRIEDAARGAKLLAISFVQYLSGYRADLRAIGEICRRHNVFFFVDAIQGLGAFPLDVRAMNINALAADSHKWMLGPEGQGILYVQRDWQDRIEPMEFGWTTVAGFADYNSRDMAVRADAARYECGTLNTIGIHGLQASLEMLLEAKIDAVADAVRARADEIARGAARRGYEVLGPERTAEHGAGIVSIRHPELDARLVCSRLRELNIETVPRQGWVRCAPHFYITPTQIERLIDALPEHA